MRRLDVLFTPAEAGASALTGKLVFPVDVLRFTTSAVQAFASGARALYPFGTLHALEQFAASRPREEILTAGEHDGIPLSGLDLGNSPAAFTETRCLDRDVLMVTTNGTGTLEAVKGAGIVLPLGFVNLSAVAEKAASIDGDSVVVCSGWKGNFSLEDALCAGAFVVESVRRNPSLQLGESAKAARDLFTRAGKGLAEQVRSTSAAKRLEALGFSDDVDFCLDRDSLPIVLEALEHPHRVVVFQPPRMRETPSQKVDNKAGEKRAAPPPPPPKEPPPPTTKGEEPRSPLENARKRVDSFRMPLAEHLKDLRRRVILSLVFIILGFAATFAFRTPVVNVVFVPVRKAFDAVETKWAQERAKEDPGDEKSLQGGIIANAVQEKFISQMKICFVIGIFFASPLVFWQLWMFVSAGLYPWERKWVYIFAPATYVCFSSGVVFLYFVVLPLGLEFLLGFGYHPKVMLTMGYGAYVGFFLLLSVVMGLTFELPLVMLFLSKLGLVAPKTYRAKRKYIVIAIFLGAAIITPPDVITQVLVAMPLLVLYEIGILLSKLVYKTRETT